MHSSEPNTTHTRCWGHVNQAKFEVCPFSCHGNLSLPTNYRVFPSPLEAQAGGQVQPVAVGNERVSLQEAWHLTVSVQTDGSNRVATET